MLEKTPTDADIIALIGQPLFDVWTQLASRIEEKYNMEIFWNSGGKKWVYERKYRRGGKTLCAFYAKPNTFGFMLIFGEDERKKFEAERSRYPQEIQRIYDDATTYHDGKWMMFEPVDTSLFESFDALLQIKRKPNRK